MKFRVIEDAFENNETPEVIHIDFDVESLLVTIRVDGYRIDIEFDSPIGFRVLDEGDLCEFWSTCSSKNGWLHQILSGGWLDQEKQRPEFLSAHVDELKEYLVIGCNFCVGVFAWEDPSVSESTR